MGDLESALEDYSVAIRLNPRARLAFYTRGGVRERMGDYQAAAKDYQRYIDLADTERGNERLEAKIRELKAR
jgi:regulator of sirC expression with transglutaminase-like and TPR domain